ncbi:uncharacterized protein MONBRDRAFT_34046 [Monosiga brevicollis MX1]|uniref:V-type proton ATPase subunit H n=1 Tax=Monosiga brevicollis TaxID=81824 RepID=A9V9J6_MONBE|nr:uncharacterized protein MONBRDRAFT_34046 [Monosiga brevicollis MX1]EDQ85875.1 predicted protein [Monosiga brevicollis MX1]|eukprot:XP_001749354.1 hypothetical protein [Monosiga brevicollis MX1]
MAATASTTNPQSGSAAGFEDPRKNSILEQAERIRSHKVPWEAFSGIAGDEAVAAIKQLDGSSESTAAELAKADPKALIATLKLFSKLSNAVTLEYLVTLLDDFAELDSAHTSRIMSAGEKLEDGKADTSIDIFVKRLAADNDYVAHQAARMLARFALDGFKFEEDAIKKYLDWAANRIASGDRPGVLLALTSLSRTFRKDEFREGAVKHATLLDVLKTLLTSTSQIQTQYQVLLVLWVLTFTEHSVAGMRQHAHALLTPTAEIMKAASKEKVVRMAFGFARNMIVKSAKNDGHEYCALLIKCVRSLTCPSAPGTDSHIVTHLHLASIYPPTPPHSHKVMPRVTELVTQQPYSDEDLLQDATEISEQLKMVFESLSSYDEYLVEAKSGALRWSPVHRSERFWHESVARFNDNDYELLKIVAAYLDREDDAESVAVAIHDCGEYVRHYPYGKNALSKLGAKEKIMALMEGRDQRVRYEALIAVQKMMTDHWEFLGQQTRKVAEGVATK